MRTLKPFTPLLGETFEYARPDKGAFLHPLVRRPLHCGFDLSAV
jgi:hypothetical protein